MFQTLIITCAVSLGVGVIAVLGTYLICKSRYDRTESQLRTDRDIARQSAIDRDTAIKGLEQQIHDIAERDLGALNEAKAERNLLQQKCDSFQNEITQLATDKAELSERAKRLESSNRDALGTKDQHVADTLRAKERHLEEQLAQKDKAVQTLLDAKDAAIDDQKRLLADTEKVLTEKFGAVSLDALKTATQEFMKLAETKLSTSEAEAAAKLEEREHAISAVVKPLKETLDKLDERQRDIESKRLSAYDGMTIQITDLMKQTGQLSNALRRPTVRGNWGEITLRTVADNAGLIEGQDYHLQASTSAEDGRQRPDMIVRLPNKRSLVIDSKVPMDAYREAVSAETDDERKLHLDRHCRAIREFIKNLSSKSYSSQKEGADFVIMFLPTEAMYHAAIEHDAEIVNYAFDQRVILVNPVTLVCCLKSVAYILDIERLNESATEIKEIGEKLYDGIRVLGSHMKSLSTNLGRTVESYNKAVGSLERNVLSKARQLRSKGVGKGDDIPEIEDAEVVPAAFRTQELIHLTAGEPEMLMQQSSDQSEPEEPLTADVVSPSVSAANFVPLR